MYAYTIYDRVTVLLLLLMPLVGFYLGVRHAERAQFRRYEQQRMTYTRNRLRNL